MKDQNISPEEIDSIERYINNTMNEKERSEFEKSIENDKPLLQKVGELKVLFQAVEEQSLRDKLNVYHKEIPSKEKKGISIKLYKQFAFAASIVILIGFGIWMIFSQKTHNEKLFAEYFSPDPGLVTPMSTGSNYEFYRGMVDYKQANYKLAIERWQTLLVQKPKNDTLNFYLGVSTLALGKSKKSIDYLLTATHTPQSKFISEAYYYLGLAYMNDGATKEALNAFNKSSEVNARAIIKQLN